MTPSRLEELRKVAEEAMPHWWVWEPTDYGSGNKDGKANDAFIAAANPAVVLELLDTIKTLREALERINREAYASPSYAESIKKIRVIARDAIGETK